MFLDGLILHGMAELLTIPEAASRIKKTPATLYAAISRGDLLSSDQYGRKLVTVKELARYCRQTKIGRPKNGTRKAGAK